MFLFRLLRVRTQTFKHRSLTLSEQQALEGLRPYFLRCLVLYPFRIFFRLCCLFRPNYSDQYCHLTVSKR